jgi:phospholipid-transporting ATPase
MKKSIWEQLGLKHQQLNKTFVPQGSRNVHVNGSNDYLDNSVSTAKYNAYTLLPRFIIQFFSSYANVFFLFTGCLQLTGDLSPTNRFGTILPLAVIFALQLSKEKLEDSKRHQSDQKVNNSPILVLRNHEFVSIPWKELKVGDIVRVENSQSFPADLVLLSSSEPDALCYIETANLDG